MKRLFAAVALATVTAPGLPAPAIAQAAPAQAAPAVLPDADPALWVVKDKDTTIYLFGTFHALDGKADWFNDEVKAAFDTSGELVTEIALPEDPAALQPVIARHAVDRSGRKLSARLSPAAREKLKATLAAMGAPADAFEPLRPYFAAVQLVAAESQKLGLTGEKGAEATLTRAAKASGKTLGSLETMEFQLSMFDALSDEEQVRMLEQTLDQLGALPAMFAQMQRVWSTGDAEGMAQLMQTMDASSPAAYRAIFLDRNATWSGWIAKRLDTPGTVFVAVGAGHLGGKDSVQRLLAKRGIKAKRVRGR